MIQKGVPEAIKWLKRRYVILAEGAPLFSSIAYDGGHIAGNKRSRARRGAVQPHTMSNQK